MMRKNKSTEKIGVTTGIPPVILPKFKSNPNFPVPKCTACQPSISMNLDTGLIKQAVLP